LKKLSLSLLPQLKVKLRPPLLLLLKVHLLRRVKKNKGLTLLHVWQIKQG
jgi:hypothetical protein